MLGGGALVGQPPNSQGLCGSVCNSIFKRETERTRAPCRSELDEKMWEHTRFPGPLPLPPWRREASVPQLRRVAPPRAAGRVGRSSAIPGLESDWSAEPVLFSGFSIGASKQLRSRLGRSHCVIAPKAHLHRDWPTDDSPANQSVPSQRFARLRNGLLGGPSLVGHPPKSQGLCGSV